MLNYAYYPFSNNLDELQARDLSVLTSVAEGWYIDYKSQPIKTIDFAKHLAAFANQHGGFLFIGIKENLDTKCAGDFPGIAISALPNLSIQIREASSAHINPPVMYEEKVLQGPCDEIGLPAGSAILVIGIPKSVNTPHIHSSGRIYRRLADHSDPKPETDRHILDELWKRGEEHKIQVSKFLSITPPLPSTQEKSAWIYIYFRPDENQPNPTRILSFEEFCEAATNSTKNSGLHIPMDAIYRTQDGFIARQTGKNSDNAQPALTLRWWHGGTTRLDIPVNKYTLDVFLNRTDLKYLGIFHEVLRARGINNAVIIDYSMLVMICSGLANMYLELLRKIDDKRDIFSSFILKNVSYTSPYLNSERYVSRVKEFSLPLVAENEIRVPDEPNQSNMFKHKYSLREEFSGGDPYATNTRVGLPIVFATPLFDGILKSVGAVNSEDDWLSDSEVIWTTKFSELDMSQSKGSNYISISG